MDINQDTAVIESWLNLRDRISICYERMSIEMPQYTELHQMLDYLYQVTGEEEIGGMAKIALKLDGIGAGAPIMEGQKEGVEAIEKAMSNPIWSLGPFVPAKTSSLACSSE